MDKDHHFNCPNILLAVAVLNLQLKCIKIICDLRVFFTFFCQSDLLKPSHTCYILAHIWQNFFNFLLICHNIFYKNKYNTTLYLCSRTTLTSENYSDRKSFSTLSNTVFTRIYMHRLVVPVPSYVLRYPIKRTLSIKPVLAHHSGCF